MELKNSYLKNYRLLIGLAVIFGLLTAYMGYRYVSSMVGLRPVVLVNEDVQTGTKIEKGNLKVVMLPRGGVNSDVLQNVSDTSGLFAKGFIPANTPLRASMLGSGVSGNPIEDLARYPGRVLLGLDYSVSTTAGFVVRSGVIADVDAVKKKDTGGEVKPIISGAPVLYAGGQGSQAKQSVVFAVLPEEKQNYLSACAEGDEFIVTVKGVAR